MQRDYGASWTSFNPYIEKCPRKRVNSSELFGVPVGIAKIFGTALAIFWRVADDKRGVTWVCCETMEAHARSRMQGWLQDLLEADVTEFLGRGIAGPELRKPAL